MEGIKTNFSYSAAADQLGEYMEDENAGFLKLSLK